MCSLINKQLVLLTAYAYLFITEQQKAQQGSEALLRGKTKMAAVVCAEFETLVAQQGSEATRRRETDALKIKYPKHSALIEKWLADAERAAVTDYAGKFSEWMKTRPMSVSANISDTAKTWTSGLEAWKMEHSNYSKDFNEFDVSVLLKDFDEFDVSGFATAKEMDVKGTVRSLEAWLKKADLKEAEELEGGKISAAISEARQIIELEKFMAEYGYCEDLKKWARPQRADFSSLANDEKRQKFLGRSNWSDGERRKQNSIEGSDGDVLEIKVGDHHIALDSKLAFRGSCITQIKAAVQEGLAGALWKQELFGKRAGNYCTEFGIMFGKLYEDVFAREGRIESSDILPFVNYTKRSTKKRTPEDTKNLQTTPPFANHLYTLDKLYTELDEHVRDGGPDGLLSVWSYADSHESLKSSGVGHWWSVEVWDGRCFVAQAYHRAWAEMGFSFAKWLGITDDFSLHTSGMNYHLSAPRDVREQFLKCFKQNFPDVRRMRLDIKRLLDWDKTKTEGTKAQPNNGTAAEEKDLKAAVVDLARYIANHDEFKENVESEAGREIFAAASKTLANENCNESDDHKIVVCACRFLLTTLSRRGFFFSPSEEDTKLWTRAQQLYGGGKGVSCGKLVRDLKTGNAEGVFGVPATKWALAGDTTGLIHAFRWIPGPEEEEEETPLLRKSTLARFSEEDV